MPVIINGVDKQGIHVNGVQTKQTLNAANETVNKGVYDATTLSAVDVDLATANIKSGVTVFGKAGSTNVRDSTDADAAVGNVLSPKTFYAGGGVRKTGTMPTVAIVASNDVYSAGYHAGDAGGLDAIDTDLSSANIKSGVTIFGKAGVATVQEIGAADAAVTDVKSPRTFFSVTGGVKIGTMPTVALAAGSNSYPAGYHAGAASLATVDADLAAGNIKSGTTIFGTVGTYVSPLSEDLVNNALTATISDTSQGGYKDISVNASSDSAVIATITPTFSANSMAVGVAAAGSGGGTASNMRLRLYMGGVQVAESDAYLGYKVKRLVATRALSGVQTIYCAFHNYDAGVRTIRLSSPANDPASESFAFVAVGSVKAT